MADLITAPAAGLAPAEIKRLTALSTAELRAELSKQMGVTATHLVRLAWIVRTLEERGEDLADLRVGLLDYLRLIAHGQMAPEAVVRFAQTPSLLQRVARLPLPDQRRLAAGEPVKLLVLTAEGGVDHLQADPGRMTQGQLAQVFARDHLRSEAEQRVLLEDRRSRPPRQRRVRGAARPDVDRGGLVVGKTFLPQADVVAALALLRPQMEAEGGVRQMAVSVSEAEARHIHARAAEVGSTASALIRQALRAYGLLSAE